MQKIAIWGYGIYGQRLHTIIKKFSKNTEVSRIYDQKCIGKEKDGYMIADPKSISIDYRSNMFSAVMVCVNLEAPCHKILETLRINDIPVYTPCVEEDFVSAQEIRGFFEQAAIQEGYRMYCFQNLRGITLVPSSGIMYLFDKTGRHLKEQWDTYDVKEVWTHKYDLPVNPRSQQPEVIHMTGSYCILAKLWAFNYFHFSFESMDCVQLLEEEGFSGRYIVTDRSYIRELLQIYGIPEERIITLNDLEPGRCYEFEEVRYPKLQNNNRRYSAKVLKRMAKKVQQQLTVDPEKYPSFLYVKRVGTRKLLNGSEIAMRNGFTEMIPEEHSLLEQLNYYYNAKIVFSPHGANNTSSLYMRSDTVLIETFGPSWVNYIFTHVLKEKHMSYLPVVQGPIMPKFSDIEKDMNLDYSIDEINLQMAIDIAFRLMREKEAL